MTFEEICKTIGEDLAAARKVRRHRMEDAAARIGTTRQTLARLEAGDAGVSIGIMVRAAIAYGLDANLKDLFDPAVDPEALRKIRHEQPDRIRTDTDDLGSLDF